MSNINYFSRRSTFLTLWLGLLLPVLLGLGIMPARAETLEERLAQIDCAKPYSQYWFSCEGQEVVRIYLSFQGLTGPIPESLSALTHLQELRLDVNQLTGPIPESLSALTNLRVLFLYGNQLTGLIPESLSALTNLQELRLGVNQLTGPIPESLSALTNLQTLWLGDNRLTGPIPESLSALTNLQSLWLGGNRLTGPIPESLSALTNLQSLGLGDNRLIGPIPESLRTLTNLNDLSLSNNQLCGPIPDLSFVQVNADVTEADYDGVDLTDNKLCRNSTIDYSKVPGAMDYPLCTTLDTSCYATPSSSISSLIPDPNLEAVVRVAIAKPTGEILTSDLQNLTFLSAGGKDITNLEGLQYCTSLQYLSLYSIFKLAFSNIQI